MMKKSIIKSSLLLLLLLLCCSTTTILWYSNNDKERKVLTMASSNKFVGFGYLLLLLIILFGYSFDDFVTNAETTTDIEENEETRMNTIDLFEVEHEIGYILGLKLQTPPLYSQTSKYQQIEIYNSDYFGKVFILDECLQLTERDAANYNEMLAHVPIMEYIGRRRKKKDDMKSAEEEAGLNVLVLGGGDGYVVSEVLKHPIVKKIDHCDLDEDIIKVSEQFFPWAKNLWHITESGDETSDATMTKNSRLSLHIGDGAAFVKNAAMNKDTNKPYHVIIQDSSDPFMIEDSGELITLPSHVLYTKDHFQNIYNVLKVTNGVLIFQAESYNLPTNLKEVKKWRELLLEIGFRNVRYGSIYTPTYSTGQIGFFVAHAIEDDYDVSLSSCKGEDEKDMVCSKMNKKKGIDDEFLDYDMMQSYFETIDGKTSYYYPQLHRSSYHVPLWVHEYVYNNT